MRMVGNIEETWSTYTGKGTTIAIIDDGFDVDHPEYKRSDGSSAILLDKSASFIQDGNKWGVTYYKDDNTCLNEGWDNTYNEWDTHGTATSTTAAAPMGNGGGVGIAPEADILALKIDFSWASIQGAIAYAIEQGVDVINMSLGAYGSTFVDGFGETQKGGSNAITALEQSCKNAYNAGIIVVAAAGNEATSQKSYPACNYKVIGVGALDKNDLDTIAPFSNYNGASQTGEVNVDIFAPGFVWTAQQTGKRQTSHNHSWVDTQGTSFSSPIVAGAACLWKQQNPTGTPDQFRERLLSTAQKVGTYKNKMIPVTSWSSTLDADVGPSNVTGGALDVGALLGISNVATSMDLDRTSLNMYTGGHEYQLVPTINPAGYSGNKTINWTTNNASVATVSNTGLVTTGSAVGSATITATLAANTNIKASCVVTTSAPIVTTDITCSVDSFEIEVGEDYNLSTKVKEYPVGSENAGFDYESNDTSVATVTHDGIVTGVKEGNTTISVFTYDSYLNVISIEVPVTVKKAAPISEVTFNFANKNQITSSSATQVVWIQNDVTFTAKKTGTESFCIGNSDYTSNPLRLYVSNTAAINAPIGKRIKKLTFACVDSSYASTLKSCTWTNGTSSSSGATVTVNGTNLPSNISFAVSGGQVRLNSLVVDLVDDTSIVRVTDVSLDKTSLTIDLNTTTTTAQLTATVAPSDASDKSISWSSSDDTVASVSNGLVTAKKVGSATITVTTTDGNKTATCLVTVVNNKPVPQDDYFNFSNQDQITSGDSTTSSVTWTTSTGVTLTITKGTNTTQAYYFSPTLRMYSNFTGVFTAPSGTIFKSLSATCDSSYSAALNNATWTNATSAVSNNVVTITASPNAETISFKMPGNGSARISKITVELINKASLVAVTGVTLDQTTATIDLKNATKTLQLSETVAPTNATDKSVSWKSDKESVATVSSTGLVTAKAVGEATITVTTTDGKKTATCAITVVDTTPVLSSIEVSSAPATISYYGKADFSSVRITAHYTNGGADKTNIIPTTVEFAPGNDTRSLGNKTVNVSYTENGVTKTTTFTIFVTNNGAVQTMTPAGNTNTTYVFTSKSFADSTNSWTSLTDGFGYEESRGIQRTAGTSSAETKNSISNITKITIQGVATKSGVGTYNAYVNGTLVGSKNIDKNTTSDDYVLYEGSALTGKVKIEMKCTTNSIYLKSVTISTASESKADWTYLDQATATINFIKQYRSCANDFTRNDIVNCVNEYNYMKDATKELDIWEEVFMDQGYSVTAIEKLMMMVKEYNSTLQGGESELTLRLPNGVEYKGQTYNPLISVTSDTLTLIVVNAIMIAMISSCLFFYLKRKRK